MYIPFSSTNLHINKVEVAQIAVAVILEVETHVHILVVLLIEKPENTPMPVMAEQVHPIH